MDAERPVDPEGPLDAEGLLDLDELLGLEELLDRDGLLGLEGLLDLDELLEPDELLPAELRDAEGLLDPDEYRRGAALPKRCWLPVGSIRSDAQQPLSWCVERWCRCYCSQSIVWRWRQRQRGSDRRCAGAGPLHAWRGCPGGARPARARQQECPRGAFLAQCARPRYPGVGRRDAAVAGSSRRRRSTLVMAAAAITCDAEAAAPAAPPIQELSACGTLVSASHRLSARRPE